MATPPPLCSAEPTISTFFINSFYTSHGYLRLNTYFAILYYLRNPRNLRADSFCPTDPTDEHRFLSYSIIRVICGNKLTPYTPIYNIYKLYARVLKIQFFQSCQQYSNRFALHNHLLYAVFTPRRVKWTTVSFCTFIKKYLSQ